MNGFDAQRLCLTYGIPYSMTDAGRGGWLNVCCPFCPEGDSKFKLGINPKGYGHCWRCGGHDLEEILCKLLGIRRRRALELRNEFRGSGRFLDESKLLEAPATVVPPGAPLGAAHKEYLRGRGFDPDWLAVEYGLLGTAPDEEWQGKFFGNRVIIPIRDSGGKVCSFQGRDITGESKLRYKGCPIELSPLHYKRTLYGVEFARAGFVVVVEGIFDQWRLGRGSVATYGTDLTRHQIALLAKFQRLLFAFDSEPKAQEKAMKYARELAAMGREVGVVDLELGERDLGDLSEAEAAAVRIDLGLI